MTLDGRNHPDRWRRGPGPDKDRGVSVERGLELFERIRGAEFHLFDNCAHWVQWDQADRFNRLVIDFLKSAS